MMNARFSFDKHWECLSTWEPPSVEDIEITAVCLSSWGSSMWWHSVEFYSALPLWHSLIPDILSPWNLLRVYNSRSSVWCCCRDVFSWELTRASRCAWLAWCDLVLPIFIQIMNHTPAIIMLNSIVNGYRYGIIGRLVIELMAQFGSAIAVKAKWSGCKHIDVHWTYEILLVKLQKCLRYLGDI